MSDDPASKDAFRWELRQRLVERLRIPWDGMGDMGNQQRAEAALAISTMMDEVEAMERSIRHLHRDYADMRARLTEANLIAAGMQDEITKLKGQLDDLRRSWCAMIASGDTRVQDPRRCLTQASMIAASNGWDCMHEIIDQQPDRLLYPRANERIV